MVGCGEGLSGGCDRSAVKFFRTNLFSVSSRTGRYAAAGLRYILCAQGGRVSKSSSVQGQEGQESIHLHLAWTHLETKRLRGAWLPKVSGFFVLSQVGTKRRLRGAKEGAERDNPRRPKKHVSERGALKPTLSGPRTDYVRRIQP